MSVKKLFDLSGKTAVVTGGSRGLGLQMAEALGVMGARVAITARKQDELEEAAAHLAQEGVEVLPVAGDLARLDTIAGMVEQIVARFGAIDVLVNNAGTSWGAPAEDHPLDAWRKVMTLNVDATFLTCQAVARRCMIPRRAGKILNVASVAGLSGNTPDVQTAAYNTSKAAVINLTRALAAEWGKHDVNVNAVCPGFFPSKLARGLLDRIEQAVVARTPLGRLGGDEDLKGAVAFLASAASRHVTGQAIVIDGGYSVA